MYKMSLETLLYERGKKLLKSGVKGLRSQYVEAPTGQIQDNLSFNKGIRMDRMGLNFLSLQKGSNTSLVECLDPTASSRGI